MLMMMTPRDISTVQEEEGRDNDPAPKVSRERGGVNVTIGAFHTRPLNLASLARNLAMIRRFSRLTFRHSLARSPARPNPARYLILSVPHGHFAAD